MGERGLLSFTCTFQCMVYPNQKTRTSRTKKELYWRVQVEAQPMIEAFGPLQIEAFSSGSLTVALGIV